MLGLIATLSTAAWNLAVAQQDNAAVGLRGIIPETVPESLSEAEFSELLGETNWEPWAQETAALVARFYEDESLDAAGQRDALNALQRKIRVMERALDDPRYRQLYEPITTLHGRLVRRVDVYQAAWDTLTMDPQQAHSQRLGRTREELGRALENIVNELRSVPNGEAWLPYVQPDLIDRAISAGPPNDSLLQSLRNARQRLQPSDRLDPAQSEFLSRPAFRELDRALGAYLSAASQPGDGPQDAALREALAALVQALEQYEQTNRDADARAVREAYAQVAAVAPDGGERMTAALRRHYFNYNLRVVASEALLQRMLQEEPRVDQGPVDDFILGAKVNGWQTTTTYVGFDLKPSRHDARFDITLNGVVQSGTQGVTEQATVFTSGYHQFYATKEVVFDGDQFVTGPAQVAVTPSNTTTGATTDYSDIPLLGKIADRIAVSEAQERRPESEAIAASRVSGRLIPEFNQEVDQQFQQANAELRGQFEARLREAGLYPSARKFTTTDTELRVSTRLMADDELGAGTPNRIVQAGDGAVVHVHESLINNSLDRMQLANRTLTQAELQAEFENALTTLLGREVRLSDDETQPPEGQSDVALVFPAEDPIRVRAENGVLTLVIRAGLDQPEGEEDIPTQEISVPLMFRIEGDEIVVESGTVGVSPVERPESVTRQITRAGVVRTRIQSALPTRSFDRYFSIGDADERGKPPIPLAVTDIRPLNGWISIVVE